MRPRFSLNEPWAIILAAVITGLFTIVAAYATFFRDDGLPNPLAPGLPAPTITPTVVGTPIFSGPGLEIAAGGGLRTLVAAGGISVIVDEVTTHEEDTHGYHELPGYVFALVKVRVVNQSDALILPGSYMKLVDDYSNQYAPWGNLGFEAFPQLPNMFAKESGTGALVYRVPVPAMLNKLRLRLDVPEAHVRIEINFDMNNRSE